MRNQLVQVTATGIARFNDLTRPTTQHQVRVVSHVQITTFLVQIVTSGTFLTEDWLDVFVEGDLVFSMND